MSRTPRDDFLAGLVEEWKATSPPPPAELEDRILRAVRAEHRSGTEGMPHVAAFEDRPPTDGRESGPVRWLRPRSWPGPAWVAAGAIAALLLIAAGLSLRAAAFTAAPTRADRLLVVDALRETEAAEREHARAIARLQQAAQPILARATDPDLPGEQAARLMALAGRLRFLDQTIAEIRGFLGDNPAHPGARATLLAAYSEKTAVLRDVIALDEESNS